MGRAEAQVATYVLVYFTPWIIDDLACKVLATAL